MEAKILTEKVTVNGIKCRRICGFEGIARKEDLPSQYVASAPSFWMYSSAPTCHFQFDDDGIRWVGGASERDRVDLRVPPGAVPEIDVGPYILVLSVNDVWPETTFQNILIWLKRSGTRLAKIRARERDVWHGNETISI